EGPSVAANPLSNRDVQFLGYRRAVSLHITRGATRALTSAPILFLASADWLCSDLRFSLHPTTPRPVRGSARRSAADVHFDERRLPRVFPCPAAAKVQEPWFALARKRISDLRCWPRQPRAQGWARL